MSTPNPYYPRAADSASMGNMRSHRMTCAVVAGVLLSLAACGGPTTADSPSTSDSAPATATNAGTGESTGKSARVPLDVCSVLSAEKVGQLLGATVTAQEQPGGGCDYRQEDPRKASAAIAMVDGKPAGSFDSAVYGTTAALKDVKKTPLTAIGEQATLIQGKTTMGDSTFTAALGEHAGVVTTVTVLGSGVDPAKVAPEILQAVVATLD